MATPRSWLPVFLLGVVASACGEKEQPPSPPPSLTVLYEGPETEYCNAAPVALSATTRGGVPQHVEMLVDGQTVVWIDPAPYVDPYLFSFDCASKAEGSYTITFRVHVHGYSFTSPPKQIVVDRTPPTVVSGPFEPDPRDIAKDAPIRVTFSEPILSSQISANSISLVTATKTLSWSQDRKVLTVVPQEPITTPQSFALILYPESFKDLAGNPLTPAFPPMRWSWTVPAFLHTSSLPKYGNGINPPDPPAFARDRQGRFVTAWAEYTQASGAADLYVHRTGQGSTSLLGGALSSVPGGNSWVEETEVAVDASDRPVVAWTERSSGELQVFVRRWNGNSWDDLGNVPNPFTGVDAKALTLATGASDLPAVAWTEADTTQKTRVFVYRWEGSRWDAVASPIEARTATASALYPSLAIDGQNRPVLSVTEQSSDPDFQSAAVVWRLDGGSWQQLDAAIRPAAASASASVSRTSLALDPQGRPGVALELSTPGTTSSTEVYFSRYGEAGWSAPLLVDGPNARSPSLTFDSEGSPWAAWENGSGTELSSRLRKMAGSEPYAALEQTLLPSLPRGSVGAPFLLIVDMLEHTAEVVTRQ